jgi:restriction system protein
MGGIWFRAPEFGAILSEKAGYKSGLALDEPRLREFVADGGFEDLWPVGDNVMRIRSEEFEEVFAYVLHRLGIGPERFEPSPMIAVWHRVKDDPAKRDLFEPVGEMFLRFMRSLSEPDASGPADPEPFIREVQARHGREGALLAIEMLRSASGFMARNPWSLFRSVNWQSVRDLEELFKSEKLRSPHGEYFDQRFANFLAANFEEIDNINWRQFEGLATEYFKREGYIVELGPGRGDGGVDIRLWPDDGARDGGPAAVLVQCKRQQTKISNTIVKALWADVVAEDADSGLIVTTSSLAPSAGAVRTARDYPVASVDRPTLRKWVEQMRTPGTGFFLGE